MPARLLGGGGILHAEAHEIAPGQDRFEVSAGFSITPSIAPSELLRLIAASRDREATTRSSRSGGIGAAHAKSGRKSSTGPVSLMTLFVTVLTSKA